MNEEVSTYIESLSEWQRETSGKLREAVHAAIPEAQERMQYKKPHFLKNGKYAAVVSVSKDAVSFTIFHTEHISLPEGFEGPPERKTAKFRQGQAVDKELLTNLVAQASAAL